MLIDESFGWSGAGADSADEAARLFARRDDTGELPAGCTRRFHPCPRFDLADLSAISLFVVVHKDAPSRPALGLGLGLELELGLEPGLGSRLRFTV